MKMKAPKLAVLISALTMRAAYAEPMPCQGRYDVVSGNVVISGSGVVHIEPHNKSEGIFNLIYFMTTETENDVASEAREGSTTHIRFMLSSENEVLPGTRDATQFLEVCRAEEGELEPSRRVLNFKFHEIENPHGYDLFAQILEMDTGRVIAQRKTSVTGRDSAALTKAMRETAGQLDADGDSFGPLTDGKAR